ncbi:MAG TPA: PP2C family protein-serine/threonine phosphatase [Bryobacteraceae bacterium]|nr:PP2C family protein-serine/threonine phosphatase [Bryobacteraceae bacterium]
MLCTTRSQKADLIEAMDAGADDFVVKPVSAEELRVRIRAAERIVSLEQGLAERNRQLVTTNSRLQRAYEQIEADIRAAAWIQENLLPSRSVHAHGVSCNWRFRPSSYVAGDIFNFFALDDRHVGFYLLDVAGHGVPAALCSVALSMMLTPDAAHGGPLRKYESASDTFAVATPTEVIEDLNSRFQAAGDRHFSMSYGLLDMDTSLLRLAQAGNPNPVLIHSGGQVRTLTTGGMPVGLWPEIQIESVEVPFSPGDRLVLCSDGITECTNVRDEEFGDGRLIEFLAGAARQPLDSMLNGLERRLEHWHGSANFTDDVSMLAVELTGQEMQ